MPDNVITIKATDYQYPSREERKHLNSSEPQLNDFEFEHVHPIAAILSETLSPKEAHRKSNLYWWNNCLHNRISNLSHAYVHCLTHVERGIPDDVGKFEGRHYINRIQFDFYAETYYYFFSTVKDNIGQLP